MKATDNKFGMYMPPCLTATPLDSFPQIKTKTAYGSKALVMHLQPGYLLMLLAFLTYWLHF